MKKTLIIILAVVAALAIWTISTYNSLVSKQESVGTSWSNVEAQYQRRADLIPNLVATVKGYAAHESETLENVVRARSSSFSTSEEGINSFQKQENEISGALGRLLAVVERYPDLKANENFLDLQAQLEGTENRIAEARRLFNLSAKDYNTSIRRFPANIVASIFDFEKKGYFEAQEGAENAPKVEF